MRFRLILLFGAIGYFLGRISVRNEIKNIAAYRGKEIKK